ncbi:MULTISPECIES: Csu type fimbrial protein [unclassified Acidovorax]|uniref:Csu type fimbrial protein n=1 Tax=unclassified Acidovorax TaxID=2684926 RepID=UPI000AD89240|nr:MULTISPECIES: spore coat U domain-containing protein [unclassified Acidovorax]
MTRPDTLPAPPPTTTEPSIAPMAAQTPPGNPRTPSANGAWVTRCPGHVLRKACSTRWRGLGLAAVLAMCSLQAAAVCTPVESSGVLGSHPSQRVRTGSPITSTAEFRFGCGTVVLALLSAPTLKAKITTPVTGLTLKNTTNSAITVPYEIAPVGGGTYTPGLLILDLNNTNVVSLLSNNQAIIGIKISTLTGANVPAGTYTDNITVNWTYANICEGVAVGNACVGNLRTGSTDRTITVTLVVTNDCTITAPNVQFGSAPLPSAFGTVSQSITLLCTKGITYTVGLDMGSYASGARRQMASGVNRLQYNIFKQDQSVWGPLAGARVSSLGVADGLTPQVIPYTATIYADQPAVPQGSYSDSVKVDVQF